MSTVLTFRSYTFSSEIVPWVTAVSAAAPTHNMSLLPILTNIWDSRLLQNLRVMLNGWNIAKVNIYTLLDNNEAKGNRQLSSTFRWNFNLIVNNDCVRISMRRWDTTRFEYRRHYQLSWLSFSWLSSLAQLVKKFPAILACREPAFTTVRHWTQSRDGSIQSTPSHPISLRFILILSSIYA
jgi:hypothetical protein